MNGLYIDVENETKAKWQEIFKQKDVDEQSQIEIVDVTEQGPTRLTLYKLMKM